MTSMSSVSQFEYKTPESLDQALAILDTHREHARILAGGTDLIVQMKHGQAHPALIVDVKRIPELNRLDWSEREGLHIGSAVPISKLLLSSILVERFDILAQACSIIGSMQIRNRATIGGNVCNAAPSADSPPSLLCLGAKTLVASLKGTRIIPMEDFFLSPGKTALGNNELLIEIIIPTPKPSSAGGYLRHTPREEMDIAVVGVAAFLVLDTQNKKIQDARIALGAVAPTPIRVRQAEAKLIGRVPVQSILEEAVEEAAKAASPISDMRSSEGYRRELVKVLTRRTLKKACATLGIKI